MKIKRVVAYLIDIVFVYLISALLLMIPIFSFNQEEYLDYYEEYMKVPSEMTNDTVNNQYKLLYKMKKISKNSLIIETTVSFVYFGVAAYLMNGQTFGKKIKKIKVVPVDGNKLNIHLYMFRAIILTNILPKVASIISILIFKEKNWILAEGIIGNVSLTMTFLLIGVLIFRSDDRSLHDLLCKTKVIEVNKD